MRFRLGKTYRFMDSNKTMKVVGKITHSDVFQMPAWVGEDERGTIIPLGTDDLAGMGWEEVKPEKANKSANESSEPEGDGGND